MKEYYIKRNTTAIEALQKCEEMANIYGVKPTLNDFKNAIYNAPAADVKPVQHGKWIDTDTFDFHCVHIYQCSNCSKEVADNYIDNHKFCLHCGAKMDGGNE